MSRHFLRGSAGSPLVSSTYEWRRGGSCRQAGLRRAGRGGGAAGGTHSLCSSSSSATSFSNTCCSPIFTIRVAPTAVFAPPDCAAPHPLHQAALDLPERANRSEAQGEPEAACAGLRDSAVGQAGRGPHHKHALHRAAIYVGQPSERRPPAVTDEQVRRSVYHTARAAAQAAGEGCYCSGGARTLGQPPRPPPGAR